MLDARFVKRLLLAVCAAGMSFTYALPYFYPVTAYPEDSKPYVYRQFSALVIHGLQGIGLTRETAALLFIAVSGSAFALALCYYMDSFWRMDKSEIVAAILMGVFVILFQRYVKTYDMSTAFFFTYCLALMVRWRLRAYMLVFALACVNRETTILLVPVFTVYFWRTIATVRCLQSYLKYITAQVLIFITVQSMIHYAFRDADGASAWISPVENILIHWRNPLLTLAGFLMMILVLWLVHRRWNRQPVFLKVAYSILVPTFTVFYIVFGQPFEYRSLIEIYSTVALLAVPSVPKLCESGC